MPIVGNEASPLPSGERSTDAAAGHGTAERGQGVTSLQRNCPLVRAAVRLGDPAVIAAVIVLHPPFRCPAARKARPIRFEDIPREDW